MSIILDKNRGRKRPLNRSIKKKGQLSICQTREADAQPIKTVSTPVAHVNVQPTIIQAVGGDSSKYGETLAQVPFDNRVRKFYTTTSDGKNDVSIVEYDITGWATDFNNWHKTGAIWDAQQ